MFDTFSITLLAFQKSLVKELIRGVREVLAKGHRGTIHVVKAPTGAGKTIMAAESIQQLHKSNPECVFILVSPGSGGLHHQSALSFRNYLRNTMQVEVLTQEMIGTLSTLDPGTVYVLNWEKVYRGAATENTKSVMMRQDGTNGLPAVLHETVMQGGNIILVIDESHTAAAGPNITAVRDLIDPLLTLELSATPSNIPNADDLNNGDRFHRVDINDVIEAGLIKRGAYVNPKNDVDDAIDFVKEKGMAPDEQLVLLHAALLRRQRLESLGEQGGLRPLLLVQIANGSSGNEQLSWLRSLLAVEGITEENGRLAIWLSKKKINVEQIADYASSVDVLIFRQAIDTGWDCRRADVLFRMRNSSSETLETQILGRLTRTHEGRHYGLGDEDERDFAYIFANEGMREIVNTVFGDTRIFHTSACLVESLPHTDFELESVVTVRGDQGSLRESEYNKKFISVMLNAPADLFVEPPSVEHSIEVDALIVPERFDGSSDVVPAGTIEIAKSDSHLKEEALALCSSFCGPIPNRARMTPLILSALVGLCRRRYGGDGWGGGRAEFSIPLMYQAILNAEDVLRPMMVEISESAWASSVRGQNSHKTIANWKFPSTRNVSENKNAYDIIERIDGVDVKYLYTIPSIQRRKLPEQRFDNWLVADARLAIIYWWVANISGSAEGFGIPYINSEGVAATFYPDRFVMLTDGTLLLLEVKDKNDPASEMTKLKAEALARYIKRHNLRLAAGEIEGPKMAGGVVVERYGQWYLHRGDSYNWSATRGEDWSAWTPLDATFEAGSIEVSAAPALTYAS